MKGLWRDPFGLLKGFAIGDMAISFSIFIKSGKPIPVGFGVTGKMEIGTLKMAFALAFDANQGGFLINGALSRIALSDMLVVAVSSLLFFSVFSFRGRGAVAAASPSLFSLLPPSLPPSLSLSFSLSLPHMLSVGL